jgi:hypothetical protein
MGHLRTAADRLATPVDVPVAQFQLSVSAWEAGLRMCASLGENFLSDEQIADTHSYDRDGQIGDQDADPGKIVADAAQLTQLAVLHRI